MGRRVIVIVTVASLATISLVILFSQSFHFDNVRTQNQTPASQRLAGPAEPRAPVTASLQPPGASTNFMVSPTPGQDSPLMNGIAAGKEMKHDRSPRLSDMPAQPETPPAAVHEMGEGEDLDQNQLPGPVLPQISDPVLQSSFGSLLSVTAPLTPALNFEGIGNLDNVYPPDATGDVGPNNYVQWVNLHFQIFDKTGKSLLGPYPGSRLWAGFGAPCESENIGDVQVLYDSLADRWVMAQFTGMVLSTFSPPYGECIAVSTGPDPTGAYYRYFFQFSTTVFYDYPKLGLWPDGYYLTANRFTTSNETYQGPSAIALDRTAMLNGAVASFQEFQIPNSYGTLLPVNLDGSTSPPAGEPAFFADLGTNQLDLWKFHVAWGTPAKSTFTGPVGLVTAPFNQLCPATRNCISQPGTTIGLDGVGDRLMQRLNYRNFGSYEALVVSHNVDAASAGSEVLAGVRWYEIRDPNGSPLIYQQGTFAPDTNGRWMGSIAMDKVGNIALAYSVASSTAYPGIRFIGRQASDPLGLLSLGETTIIAGSGYQNGPASRWGDYSNLVLDPVDNCTFWYTTEYVPANGVASWKTHIASFKLPSCGTSTPPVKVYLPLISR